jgi:hypothetical protein
MTSINEFVTAWWPVVAGLWTVASGVITLYARAINEKLKALTTKLDALEADHSAYKLEVAKTYMPAADIKELVSDLKAFLIRIEDKVDGRKSQ